MLICITYFVKGIDYTFDFNFCSFIGNEICAYEFTKECSAIERRKRLLSRTYLRNLRKVNSKFKKKYEMKLSNNVNAWTPI